MTDLYETLGVGKDATPAEIKRAYRGQVKQHHPDTGGDPDRFHALQRAYDVLSDENRRARYDQTGETEEPRQRDENAEALAIIGALVDELTQRIITEDGLQHFDLVADMRRRVDKRIASVKDDQKTAREFEKKASAIRKRFKAKKGNDYIGQMLDGKAAACRQAVENADRQIAVLERARAILDDAEFQVEPGSRDEFMDVNFADAFLYPADLLQRRRAAEAQANNYRNPFFHFGGPRK